MQRVAWVELAKPGFHSVQPRLRNLKLLTVIALLSWLSACSQAPIKSPEEPLPILSEERPDQDGPPLARLDPTTIKDAIPKVEPRSRYGNPPHYDVLGKRYYPLRTASGYKKRGLASWYGVKFHGQRTSSGEPYDLAAMTAAHKTLPLPTYARITNLNNGRTTIVKINDRGPFHDQRIIDLSYAAAVKLGFANQGTAPVEVETLDPSALVQPPAVAPIKPKSEIKNSLISTPPATALYLQAGVFSDRRNAEQLLATLQPNHPSANVSAHTTPQTTLYRVRLGPFATPQEAHSIAATLTAKGIKAILVGE